MAERFDWDSAFSKVKLHDDVDGEMVVLKPCPFCGGVAEVNADENWYWEWEVHCLNDIRHSLSYFDTKEEAVEEWNRRCAE